MPALEEFFKCGFSKSAFWWYSLIWNKDQDDVQRWTKLRYLYSASVVCRHIKQIDAIFMSLTLSPTMPTIFENDLKMVRC